MDARRPGRLAGSGGREYPPAHDGGIPTTLSGRRFTDAEKTEILQLYESGASSDEVASKFRSSTSSVLDVVRRLGGHVRSPGDHARALTDQQELQVIEMYEMGIRVDEIADKFNVTRSCIAKLRRKRGIPVRPQATGAVNALWKGGTRKVGGYVQERVPAYDPLSCMARPSGRGTAGYALQHRLVMARHLGRPLLSHETVHHKNGIRTDNRLENLELWSSRHPRGARVADQVAWAKEVLAQYNPEWAAFASLTGITD